MKFQFNDYVLDTDRHQLICAGSAIKVEPLVFDLLVLLAQNSGQLVSQDRIVEEIWGGRAISDSAISAAVAAARRAVGDDGKRQAVIRTVQRRGLQFVAEVTFPKGESTPLADAEPNTAHQLHVKYASAPDGTMLAYGILDDGDGLPVIVAQHFPDQLEFSWNRFGEMDRFKIYGRGRKLLRFDYRGCGLSDWDVEDLSFAAQSNDIITLADTAGFERFAVIATSSGARHAVDLAARYPDRIAGLVLIAGYCDGRSLRSDDLNQTDPILNMVKEGWNHRGQAFIFSYISLYFPTASHEWTRKCAADFQASTNAENAATVRDSNNKLSIKDMLERVQAPTLVVHSRDDAVHPLSEARKLTAGISGAEMVVMDSANMMAMPDEPSFAKELQAVTNFLTGLEQSP